jgi:hypothetical protein
MPSRFMISAMAVPSFMADSLPQNWPMLGSAFEGWLEQESFDR